LNKKDILQFLNTLNFDKKSFIIIGEASLALHGMKRNSSGICLSCPEKTANLLKKNIKDTSFNFSIENDFYDTKNIDVIEEFQVANLDSTYDYLMKKDLLTKKELKKLRLKIDSSDNYKYERELISNGINFIAGVDEVGRGPLVGPVVTACVVLPHKFNLDGLTDSKKLSEKKRNYYYEEIKKQALGIGIGMCSEKEIDEVNIYEATKIAMKRAIEDCKKNCKIEHVLIDAMKLDIDIPTTSIIKGDLLSITISAASVIAKVTRDEMLYELDKKYPMYGFKKNVGYPTKEHIEAINKYGILKEHRKSFGPVKEYIEKYGDKTIN